MHGTLDVFDWTDAKIDLLKRLIASKMSAGQVANEMGVSRGSAIGKAFRLGIKFDSNTRTNSKKNAELRVVRARTNPRPSRVVIAPEPNALRIEFGDLSAATCKWPVGEYPYKYCGHSPLGGGPYCGHHHGRAHEPDRPRNRAPRPR
jgi:GcrA cell cycle regulator